MLKIAIVHQSHVYVISEQKNKQLVWGKLVALFRCSFSDFYQATIKLEGKEHPLQTRRSLLMWAGSKSWEMSFSAQVWKSMEA